jgi:hypothetical protein
MGYDVEPDSYAVVLELANTHIREKFTSFVRVANILEGLRRVLAC